MGGWLVVVMMIVVGRWEEKVLVEALWSSEAMG